MSFMTYYSLGFALSAYQLYKWFYRDADKTLEMMEKFENTDDNEMFKIRMVINIAKTNPQKLVLPFLLLSSLSWVVALPGLVAELSHKLKEVFSSVEQR